MTIVGELPMLDTPRQLQTLSVSEASQLDGCILRLVLGRDDGVRALRPAVASAMLGTAAHHALASMARSARSDGTEVLKTREIAKLAFDDALHKICAERDANIGLRGPVPGEDVALPAHLPYYGLTRARFGRFCTRRFGDTWRWRWPPPPPQGARPVPPRPPTLSEGVNAEVALNADDGVLRGVADAIEIHAHDVTIDEFKSGEMTDDRLPAWTLQLVLYGYLYELKYGARPTRLRAHSLHGESHELAYDSQHAAGEYARVRNVLADVNRRLETGNTCDDLARPTTSDCTHCPHRAWCKPYWQSGVPRLLGDRAGVVTQVDGWTVTLTTDQGAVETIDFRWYGALPATGQRLRLLGVRPKADGLSTVDRSSSVWRCP